MSRFRGNNRGGSQTASRNGSNGRSNDQKGERPAWSKRCGGIEVAFWEGMTGEGDDARQSLQLRVKKSYFDEKENDYVESKTFFPHEVPVLAALLQDAFAAMTNMTNKT